MIENILYKSKAAFGYAVEGYDKQLMLEDTIFIAILQLLMPKIQNTTLQGKGEMSHL